MKLQLLFLTLTSSLAVASPIYTADGEGCVEAVETYSFDSSALNASKLVFENFSFEPPIAGSPFEVTPLSPPNVAFSSQQTSPDPGLFSLPNGTTTAGSKGTFTLKSFGISTGRSKTDSVQVFVLGYKPDSKEAIEEGPRTLKPMPDGNMARLEFDPTKFSGLRQVVVRAEEAGKRVAYALDDVVVQWAC